MARIARVLLGSRALRRADVRPPTSATAWAEKHKALLMFVAALLGLALTAAKLFQKDGPSGAQRVRLPVGEKIGQEVVEPGGIEPPTSALPVRRSPS